MSMLDFYLAHRTALVDYAMGITGSRVSAEDIVQEVYFLISRLDQNEKISSKQIKTPVAYLYRTVRNHTIDWLRRSSRESYQREPVSHLELFSARAPTPTPEEDLVYRQQLRLFASALAELPVRTQTAFKMHRLDNCTLQQIAEKLGISVTLVHNLICTATTHCSNRLKDGGV